MELRTTGGPASIDELQAVDAVLGPPESGWAGGARGAVDGHVAFGGRSQDQERRHLLLPVLHALYERVGWITRGGLDYVALRLGVPPAEVYGVASAYGMFVFQPTGEQSAIPVGSAPSAAVHVCDDVACRARNVEDPRVEMERRFGRAGELHDGWTWDTTPCLGCCEHGSAALVERFGPSPERLTFAPFDLDALSEVLAPATQATTQVPVSAAASAPGGRGAGLAVPQTRSDPRSLRVLRRVGVVDPGSLDSYRAAGGLQSLREAIAIGPTGVLRELKDAKLAGRGGAAFPTSVKWDSVARNPAHPHFVICNADESEPGTFKDRILMENDPFAIVEAMTIAGFTTGSDRGYLYVRGEYPLAEKRILHAVGEARSRGLLGDDVMGAGFRFDIEVRRGAGAYIAGEETALFNSIEGRRPEPRNKPPFPVDAGLFGKPTAINNVETLCNVLEVLAMGGLAYAATGTSGSTGTRLFCVSGSVEHPGLYEVPFGVSLRHLLELAGGVRSGHDLAAVLMGGAAGSFIGPDRLDLELSMEAARDAGVMLGSGVIVVFDTATDFDHVVRRITRFFRDESCGQCVPCRVGTTRLEELVGRLVERRTLGGRGDELALLADLGTVMRDASICALGQTATSAVESAVRLGIFAGAEEGS